MNQQEFEGVGLTSPRSRQNMVQRLRQQGITHPDVLKVMANVPRHIFVDEALQHRAYADTALPIGFGQTISQPYIVARMTEVLLESLPSGLGRVLEIGTGSGYQTAVLTSLAKRIYTIERISTLLERAKHRLERLGVVNTTFLHGDGQWGWPQPVGSFNAILSAAAPETLPETLYQQLAPNGVLIAPVGRHRQHLNKITRIGESDNFRTESLEAVRFVPMLSGVDS